MKQCFVCLFVSMLLLSPTSEAQAQGKGANIFKFNLDGEVTWNPCTEEYMTLYGNIIIVFREEFDANGWLHIHQMETSQGLFGVGLDTGTTYRVVGPSSIDTLKILPPEEWPRVITSLAHHQFISPGPGPNFAYSFVIHWTINANGDISAELFREFPECGVN